MFKADGTRRDFPMKRDRIVLGRTNSCDLRIPLPSVSRQHCEMVVEDDTLLVRDLGSSNGTYHNGNRVQETTLSAGDEIVIGPVVFTVTIDGEPSNLQEGDTGEAVGGDDLGLDDTDAITAKDDDDDFVDDDLVDVEVEEGGIEDVEVEEGGVEDVEVEEGEPMTGEAIDIDDEDADLSLDLEVDEEVDSPTVDLDDPISALESLADSDVSDSDDSDELPVLADEDDK